MPREVISNRQLCIILFVIRSTPALAALPFLTSADARQDAWLSTVVAMAVTLLLALSLAALGSRFPRESAVQYSIRLLGPWAGRAVIISFLFIYLFFASLELRIYADMIITGFLHETPLLFVNIAMVLLAAVAAYAGLEVFARVADLIFPLFLIAVLLSLLLPLLQADWGNLQPVLARGWAPVLRGTLTSTGLVTYLSVMAMLIPSLDRPQKAVPWTALAVFGSFLVWFFSVIAVLGVIGEVEGARSLFPVLRMIRSVSFGIFAERIEALVIIAWGLGIFIGLATFQYAGALGVSHLFGLRNYRPLVLPMAVIWVALSVHISEDVFEIRDLLQYRVMGPFGLALFVVPLVLFWGAYGVRLLLGRLGLPGGLRGVDEG